MGRLIGTTTQYSFLPGSTFTNSYTYDATSNRLSLTAPDGSITTYGYDSLNRVYDIANSWAGSFGFSYDALSRRTTLTRPNGVNTSYTYDSVSRLLSVLHQAGSTTLDGASYTYGAAGNRTSKTNYLNGITDNYTYDALYELQQVTEGTSTTESYTYDPVGNRLSSLSVPQYNYNTSNELTSTSLARYTYDHNGNTLTKADSNGTTQYSWDCENRLTQVTIPQTGGGSTVVTFKYDPFGRRIQKIAPGGTTNYLYDQVSMLEEFDISGNMVAKYAQGTAIDEPLSMMRSGNVSYDNADALGSITSLVNPAGTLATTYIYDTFGELVGSTGSLTNPFQYTGRDHDPETKLDYYRARYYDAGTGRFLAEDPAGFGGGANFFAYVKNDPADFVDPTGLKCWQSSPWTEIPNLWGPNGPTPYLTMEDGLYWVRVGWSYVSWGLISDYTHCSCRWVADHTRMRKFYRYKTTEQAQFTCDCPSSTYYEKRERTKNYEVDSPGIPSWPTQYANTTGPTLQVGEDTGSNFRNKKNVTCLCGPPAP